MTDEPSYMDAHVLGEDYHFEVIDSNGQTHDVGPLVDLVLARRRATPPDGHTMTALVETGVKLAVRTLYGEPALTAFEQHCDDVEQFLAAANTAHH